MKKILFIILMLIGVATARADEFSFPQWGLVKIAAGCMRSAPGHSSELVSQAVLGTPIRLLERENDWCFIETPDGYRGYMNATSVQPLDSVAITAWRDSRRVMYINPYTGRIRSSEGVVSDVHAGSVLQLVGTQGVDSVMVLMPDGRRGCLAKADVIELNEFKNKDIDTQWLIDMAKALLGVSYLWGGTTTAAMDCSGLAKICYLNQGIILQRDASDQALTGTILDNDFEKYQQGDLVFFKTARTESIVHVGMYDTDARYVHSSGRVKINSLDSKDDDFVGHTILVSASRIVGNIDTEGITRVTSSPFYFNL